MTKAEEIEAYEKEISCFKKKIEAALMPGRLKAEYDMMIDRLNTLLKELSNEKTDTIIPVTSSGVPSFVGKLPPGTTEYADGKKSSRQDAFNRIRAAQWQDK